jgi:hypothetical protein
VSLTYYFSSDYIAENLLLFDKIILKGKALTIFLYMPENMIPDALATAH